MAKLTQELLAQYVDGELRGRESEEMKSLIDQSPEDKKAAAEWTQIGSLLRMMDEETTAGVSFEGLSDKVLAEIKTTRASLSMTESFKVWIAEFFEHRRAVWIPASAVVGAFCLTLALMPVLNSSPVAPSTAQDSGIVLHSAMPEKGSRIAAVDFGRETGTQYVLDDGTGAGVGVVWIVEK